MKGHVLKENEINVGLQTLKRHGDLAIFSNTVGLSPFEIVTTFLLVFVVQERCLTSRENTTVGVIPVSSKTWTSIPCTRAKVHARHFSSFSWLLVFPSSSITSNLSFAFPKMRSSSLLVATASPGKSCQNVSPDNELVIAITCHSGRDTLS